MLLFTSEANTIVQGFALSRVQLYRQTTPKKGHRVLILLYPYHSSFLFQTCILSKELVLRMLLRFPLLLLYRCEAPRDGSSCHASEQLAKPFQLPHPLSSSSPPPPPTYPLQEILTIGRCMHQMFIASNLFFVWRSILVVRPDMNKQQ